MPSQHNSSQLKAPVISTAYQAVFLKILLLPPGSARAKENASGVWLFIKASLNRISSTPASGERGDDVLTPIF